MAFRVEPYQGERDPRSATLTRRRGSGEEDEWGQLLEQLMGGEEEEGLEDIDWGEMWDSFMEEEEGGQEQMQGSQYPTMFGSPNRPGGIKYPGSPGSYYY